MEEYDGSCISAPLGITVFQRKMYSTINSYIALALWPGLMHFTLALIIVSLLLLPSPFSFAVLGLLFFLTVSPLPSDENKWSQKLARYVCKYFCGYFPVSLHVEDMEAFDPDEAYVFGYEPHSVIGIGVVALSNFSGFMPFRKVKVIASSSALNTPIVRQIWSYLGFVHGTRENFMSYLASGYSCVVVPGGVGETVYMRHDSETILLEPRKGFIRIAIEMGRPLVPVFAFGQTRVYKWWKPWQTLAAKIYQVTKLPPVLIWGFLGPIPCRRPMHVVVGRPIPVNRNLDPSAKEVAEVHRQFIEAIQDLFKMHKARVGYPDLQLVIV